MWRLSSIPQRVWLSRDTRTRYGQGQNDGWEDLGSRKGARDGCCRRAERGEEDEGGAEILGSSFGVYMCVHPCACVCTCVQAGGTQWVSMGTMRREDNRVLETKLTFGSCNTGENLMRTKICLPNSPKKSLKHFVIPKCLENELVALQEPFYASPAVCSSPCRRMLRAWHSRHPRSGRGGKRGAAGRGSQPLTQP